MKIYSPNYTFPMYSTLRHSCFSGSCFITVYSIYLRAYGKNKREAMSECMGNILFIYFLSLYNSYISSHFLFITMRMTKGITILGLNKQNHQISRQKVDKDRLLRIFHSSTSALKQTTRRCLKLRSHLPK